MSSSFKFDSRAFERAVHEQVQNGVDKMAAQQTRDLDVLHQRYTGHPVAEIKPVLQQLFRRYGGTITEPQLTEWAQLISDGTRIELKAQKIRW